MDLDDVEEPNDEDLEALDGSGDVDEDEELPAVPPVEPRRRLANPAHRQVKKKPPVTLGPAPWERPRDGFTEAMTSRAPSMSATREARFVKGISQT